MLFRKLLILFTVCFISTNFLFAQGNFKVPVVSPEQKQEILYNHVMAYAVTGISFAKTKGVSPTAYGNYVGKQFIPFWNPTTEFSVFVNEFLKILCGIHPNNEMQLLEQSGTMIRFKLKNVDLAFKNGPLFGVSYKEMLEFSDGVITTIANHLNISFSYTISDKIWYEVAFKVN